MAFTGRLGTDTSQLGDIELGFSGSSQGIATTTDAPTTSESVTRSGTFSRTATDSPTTSDAAVAVVTTAGIIYPDLLGSAQIFTPTFSLSFSIGVLGPATVFAPRIDLRILPTRLGTATLITPTVVHVLTGVFTLDALIVGNTRHRHNRFSEHVGTDKDRDHVLGATINATYVRGFRLDELIRDLDRRISILESGESRYRRAFGTFTADATVKKTVSTSITADAVIS